MLENEDKIVLSAISNDLHIDLGNDLSQFKLLKYLDPYGDAIFNNLQMDDLIQDIQQLVKIENDLLTEEVLLLAKRCKAEPHTYLSFYGD